MPSFVEALFASDALKQVLASIMLAAGVLSHHAPEGALRTIAQAIVLILGPLGILSGGTTGTQPKVIQQALAQPEASIAVTLPPPKGFARTGLLLLLLALALLGLPACAAMSHSVVDTGDVDLGKGVISRTTSAPTDPVTCTQLWTQNVTFPLPKNAAGVCLLDDIVVSIPFQPGKGAQCKVSASPGATTCTKLVSTSCTVPIPRDASGACP